MNSGLFFDNKKYISAKEASALTGYSNDYIGQLCRSKKIDSRQIGRVWYVSEESISKYKNFPNGFESRASQVKSSRPVSVKKSEIETPSRIAKYKHILQKGAFEFNTKYSKLIVPVITVLALLVGVAAASNPVLSKKISDAPLAFYQDMSDVSDFYSSALSGKYVALGDSILSFGSTENENNFAAAATSGNTNLISQISLTTYNGINSLFNKYIYGPLASLFSPKTEVIVSTVKPVSTSVSKPVTNISVTTNQSTTTQVTLVPTIPTPLKPAVPVQPIQPVQNNFVAVSTPTPAPTTNVIEKIIQSVAPSDVTKAYVDQQIELVNESLVARFAGLSTGGGGGNAVTNIYQQIAESQRIDNLANTKIVNPTITGGSLDGTSINNTAINATTLSTTATSTLAASVGIGTSNPLATLDVFGSMIFSGANSYLNFGSTAGTDGYGLRDNGGSLEFKNLAGDWTGIGSGSGGSGGSGGTFSTTTSSVANHLINHPNNNSDIVAIGGTSTTTAKYYFDPNTQTAVIGGQTTLTYASTTALTVTGSSYIPKLSNLTSNGLLRTSGGDGTLSVDTTAYLAGVTVDGPLSGSGTSGSHLSISQSGSGSDGYLSSVDWSTFNSKVPTSITLTAGNGLTGGGDLSANRSFAIDFSRANNWTGLQQFANASSSLLSANYAQFGATGTTTITSAGFLGVGTSSPSDLLSVGSSSGNSAYFAGNVGIGTNDAMTVEQQTLTAVGLQIYSPNKISRAVVDGTHGVLDLIANQANTDQKAVEFDNFSGKLNIKSLTDSLDDNLVMQTFDLSTGNVGFGSTTPGTILSIGNTGNNTINIDPNATSTFGSGINIRTGCFAIGGTCLGSGAGTVTSITASTPNGTLSLGGTNPITTSGTISFDLNLGNANVWTGLQQFKNSSSSVLSAYQASFGATATSSFSSTGVLTLSSALGINSGGTGLTSYTSGDVLYADGSGNLTKLPKSSDGLVLKLNGGFPSWQTDISTGGGGGSTAWSTSTDNLVVYPTNTTNVVVLGAMATSTTAGLGNIFEVAGNSFFGGNVRINGHASTTLLSVDQNGTATTTILSNATSTIASGLSTPYLNITGTAATSTFANGLNLTGGCLSINGVCFTSSASSNPVDPFTHTAYAGQTVSATSTALLLQGAPYSVLASSTALFTYASTTALSVSGNAYFNSRVAIGGLSAISSSKVADIEDSFTDVTGDHTGVYSAITQSVATNKALTGTWGEVFPTANSGKYGNAIAGAYGEVKLTGDANAAYTLGALSLSNNIGAGTVDQAMGSYNEIWKGAGTITNGFGVYYEDVPNANPDTSVSSGSIINQYGLELNNLTRGTTRNVGILIDDSSLGATPTGNFGILEEQNYPNAFAGKLGLSTTSPFARLAVEPQAGDLWAFAVGSSTKSLLSVSGSGFGTTTLAGLDISALATSTSNVGFNLTSGCFAKNGTCLTQNLGTVTSITASTPNSTLSLGGTNPITTSGTISFDLNLGHANNWTALQQFANSSSTVLSANYSAFGATGTTTITSAGFLGVGTTSPFRAFSVQGSGVFTGGDVTASTLTATSSIIIGSNTTLFDTATSTFGAGIAGTYLNLTGTSATSTLANGLSLSGGCFSLKGTCISGTVTSVALSDGNGTLSIGGTPITSNGTLTATLNLAHANIWSALQQFANASSSALSANYAAFGATGTTTITSAGFLGVGTTTPWALFSINPDNIGSGIPEFSIGSSTSTHLIVTGNGNVGIATTSPSSLFSIGNTNGINFSTATSTFSSTGGINLASGCFAIGSVCIGANSSSQWTTLGNNIYYTSTFGGIGIGTTTPNVLGQLDVASTSPALFLTATNAPLDSKNWGLFNSGGVFNIGTSSDSMLSTSSALSIAGSSTSIFGFGTTTPWADFAIDSEAGDPAFAIGSSTATSLVVDKEGRVGVNTAGPLSNFSVNGGVAIGSYATTNTAPSNGLIVSGNVGIGTTTPWAQFAINPIAGQASNEFVVGSSSATSFIINSSGTVGIATSSPTNNYSFAVNDSGYFSNSLTVGTTITALTSATTPTLIGGNTASSVLSLQSTSGVGVTDAIKFLVGNNGATEYGRITDGGNFGIGTTTPHPLGMIDFASTTPYIFLTDTNAPVGAKHWYSFVNDGTFEIGTTSDTLLTSTSTAFSISAPTAASPGTTLGVATTSPWRTLSIAGSVGFDGLTAGAGAGTLCLSSAKEVTYSAGATCTVSSERFKHDIATSTVGLDFVNELRPVTFEYNADIGVSGEQFGFIAEDVEKLDPRLVVHDAQGLPYSVRYENMTAVLAKAIQDLDMNIESIASTTTPTAAGQNFATAFFSNLFNHITVWLADAANGIQNIFAKQVTTNTLCVSDDNGAKTCITKAQLDTLLADAGSSGGGGGGNASSTPDTTAPVIIILGNNPATVSVGATYSDMGATVTDTDGSGNINNNLGLHFNVDGVDVGSVSIDTSSSTTHTIIYSATDGAGNTGTATRIVNVQ